MIGIVICNKNYLLPFNQLELKAKTFNSTYYKYYLFNTKSTFNPLVFSGIDPYQITTACFDLINTFSLKQIVILNFAISLDIEAIKLNQVVLINNVFNLNETPNEWLKMFDINYKTRSYYRNEAFNELLNTTLKKQFNYKQTNAFYLNGNDIDESTINYCLDNNLYCYDKYFVNLSNLSYLTKVSIVDLRMIFQAYSHSNNQFLYCDVIKARTQLSNLLKIISNLEFNV